MSDKKVSLYKQGQVHGNPGCVRMGTEQSKCTTHRVFDHKFFHASLIDSFHLLLDMLRTPLTGPPSCSSYFSLLPALLPSVSYQFYVSDSSRRENRICPGALVSVHVYKSKVNNNHLTICAVGKKCYTIKSFYSMWTNVRRL